MGSILINVPDIPDSELVYDEIETKRILNFFWPFMKERIEAMQIENDVRRLAQTALIAAIEASYALGFIHALAYTVARPGSGIKSLCKKLASRFVKHWWKHTTQRDLENVKIYDRIKDQVARALRHRLENLSQGVALRRIPIPFYVAASQSDAVWV
ncbi:hypothetical protein RY831_13405 [Noviherbaspirillum sp. CPCC 100848]|uniref:Uncharacterized protein n=1 Tax=Noviherbaspirillum album TaxID=3080276 RepID=A0ABU6J947_9BURK|nr:hypothetical protein [Noviherbaspirillum sp. CPCC 100848]MEC4720154.1 hypothetical protein [Noviherbaspirillum sp. CPCC 100848]